MAIDRSPVYKRCRYLGIEPIILGYAGKPSRRTRQTRNKPSGYALQLKEKQKLKFVYGVMERQFRLAFEDAARAPGITGENLLEAMESRLDNVAFRLGLASTRRAARQLVGHGHLTVNGRRADVPSLRVSTGDVVAVRSSSAPQIRPKALGSTRKIPSWLDFDPEALKATVSRRPARSDIDFDIKESMIVELYSK